MNFYKSLQRYLLERRISLFGISAVALLMVLVVAKSFVLEDAFIVFRSVQNFHNGFDFSAIANIRSQSYTSNLWTLFLLLGGFFTHDLPNLAVIISLALTFMLAVALILFFADREKPWVGIFSVLLLAISNTFTDYSTGGLENPLAHFLLLIFCMYVVKNDLKKLDFLLLSFLAGLLVVNRFDHILLILPAMTLVFISRGIKVKDFLHGLIGFTSLWLWMAFAWFYYGSALPDTYYAKINTGVPVMERVNFAIFHHLRLLDLDFIGMLLMILASLWWIKSAIIFTYRSFCQQSESASNDLYLKIFSILGGVFLYNLYFFQAGGDYMAGRFASIMILATVFSLALFIENNFISRNSLISIFVIVSFLSALKLFTPNLFVPGFEARSEDRIVRAITFDQRLFAQNWYFIGQDHKKKDWRRLGFERALIADQKPYPFIIEHNSAGMIPYYSGSRSYIIDRLGLSDPLLSRLPCTFIGAAAHCERIVPAGYKNFLETGSLLDMDQDLAKYVDVLFKIKTLPLFDMDRLKLLIAFSLKRYESSRLAYIAKHESEYYQPGSSSAMFRHAYSETILAPFFGLHSGEQYVHPWW